MTGNDEMRPLTERDYAAVEQAFDDAVANPQTRRVLLGRAGKALAVIGGGAVLASHAVPAAAAGSGTSAEQSDSVQSIKATLASFEVFGVTFITEAVRRAPGTPSAQFLPVLKSANTAEYDHFVALRKIGAEPIATRIWLPEYLFGDGGIGLFQSIENDEDIEISAYLVGVTSFARARDTFGARLCAEALGTESEHRVLARDAQATLGGRILGAPNNRGFEAFLYQTGGEALRALEALGVGFGERGSRPGKFYDFPGDPRDNGTGFPLGYNSPS